MYTVWLSRKQYEYIWRNASKSPAVKLVIADNYELLTSTPASTATAATTMIKIAKAYFSTHGLQLSTDPEPKKSKTKCNAWLLNQRPLKELKVCGNNLPWVERIVHLEMTITNGQSILKQT